MMQTITRDQFEAAIQSPGGDYARTRWNYMKKVIDLINANPARSALELGPGPIPVMTDSHVMLNPTRDATGEPIRPAAKAYVHDATQLPWPVANKQYDLFVALQVWEHLSPHQKEAFQEVMRIANMAIMSFPVLWDCPVDSHNFPEHHMIDEDQIREWTLGVPPESIERVPRFDLTIGKQNGWRTVYFWRFKQDGTQHHAGG